MPAKNDVEIIDDTPGADVATRPGMTLASTETMRQQLEKYFAAVAPPEVEDSEAIALRIIGETLAAETADDVFGKRELQSWRELANVPMRVVDVKWNQSSYEGREGVYAVVTAFNGDTGEKTMLSIGSRQCMVQLFVAADKGWLPLDVKLTEGKTTRSGFTPLRLELSAD